MSKLSKAPRAEQWAGRICTQLGKSVESIIEVGRLLVKAQADLEHGEWGRLFSDHLIPVSIDTAQRWMAIANHPVLSNTANARCLPASWTTLYELTKVEPKALKNALKDGVIAPDMPRKAVSALPKKKTQRKVVMSDGGGDREQDVLIPEILASSVEMPPDTRCLFDIDARLRETFFDLTEEQQEGLLDSIRQLLSHFENQARQSVEDRRRA